MDLSLAVSLEAEMSLYDVDCELGCRLLRSLRDKIEAVRDFVLSRRDDIEGDIEDFGMLASVLDYFLEEAEGDG